MARDQVLWTSTTWVNRQDIGSFLNPTKSPSTYEFALENINWTASRGEATLTRLRRPQKRVRLKSPRVTG